MSTLSSQSRRSGFSLIEIAIALAIFVFGALAIVRIFPPALGVIRNNENRATATHLGDTMLARMSAKTALPPEAVYDVVTSNNWNDYAAAVAGTINTNFSLPSSPSDSTSALDHFRYIYGEPHYIGAGKTIILNYSYDDTLNNLSFFTDETIEDVQVGSDGLLDFSNAVNTTTGASASDPTKPNLPPNRGNGFTYYISYRWHTNVAGSPIQGVIEEPLIMQPSDTSARVFACSFITTNKAVPGGVRVRLRSSVIPSYGAINLGNQGKVIYIQNSSTSSYTLYCSYSAKDWRNIMSNVIANKDTVTFPISDTVNLPIDGIDIDNIKSVLTNSNQSSIPIPISPELTDADPIKEAKKKTRAKKGIVIFQGSSISGGRLRAIYKTLDGWANQPSVSPRSYISYDANRSNAPGSKFPTEPWREYILSADGKSIYFHASEAGKAVSVSYQSVSGTIVNGAILTIKNAEKNTFLATTFPGFFGATNSNKWVAPTIVTDLSGNPITAAAILSIQGLSIQARTAWQNGDRYEQVIVPGYRSLMP